MPKAYWIARVDGHRPRQAQGIRVGAAAAFQHCGAKYLVQGGPFTAADGQARAGEIVIVEGVEP